MASGALKLGGKSQGFSVYIRGYDQVLRNLKLTKDQRKNLQTFLEKEANKVVNTAKGIVHVKTGRLKDSHRVVTFGATGAQAINATILAGGITVRGKFVNYAVVQHQRHPWLAMALQMHKAGYMDRLAKAIKIPRG